MSRRSAVASSRLSKNGSLLKCSGTGLAESTLCSLCSRATRGRRRCVPAAAPCVRAAPQGNYSADTGAVGLALNPLPCKRFPAGIRYGLMARRRHDQPLAVIRRHSRPIRLRVVASCHEAVGCAQDMNCAGLPAYRRRAVVCDLRHQTALQAATSETFDRRRFHWGPPVSKTNRVVGGLG